MALTMADKFWMKVKKSDPCWLWTGYTDKRLGYGGLSFRGRHDKAHRVSWRIHNGEIPSGLFVLHHCDNPTCVNPDHLWLGTQKDNQQDAVRKGRSSRGERNGMAVLTVSDVRTIRDEYTGERGELTRFAKQYGVTVQAVSLVVRNKNWAWLT